MTQQTDGTTRTRSTRRRAITVVVAAVVVAAAAGVVVTLTHTGSTTSAAATVVPTSTAASPTSPAFSPGTGSSSAPTSSATTSSRAASGAATTTTTTTSGRLVPQTLSDAARRQLVADYVRDKHYQSSWISGTRPGSVYYVLDTSTGNHLAWGDFQITSSAPFQVQVDSQDGGSSSALVQKPGGRWTIYDICTTPQFLALVGPLPEGGHC